MNAQRSERVVHSYDTQQHRVLCGRPEQENSTKHARGVTCVTCRALLDEPQAGPRLVEAPSLPE